MRGFSTTALLLAAALGGRAIASDDSASSSADFDLGNDGQAGLIDVVNTKELDTTNPVIHSPASDEIVLEDESSVEWDGDWFSQSADDDVEYLQAIVERLQWEIDMRRNRFPAARPRSESAFHKIVRFLTSLGGAEETDSRKAGWHWPKFPFPPHHGHGHGNHTHGNHTCPPPHHGHGNHTWPPHHGKGNHTWPPHHGHRNHTHHGHGNHTHGNHTHPPHHRPPFRLPPHFCRPPHHRPPHHKPPPHHRPPPHHKPHPPKKPDHGSPPPPGNFEPHYKSPGEEPIFTQSQKPTSALSSLIMALNHPLFQITITPGSLLLTLALCLVFIRAFHRIRAVASWRRHHRCQRRQRCLKARGRFRNFVSRLFSRSNSQRNERATGDEKLPLPVSVPESRPPPPGYYDHLDLDDGLEVYTFGYEESQGDVKTADWVSEKLKYSDEEITYDEKAALVEIEVASEEERDGDNEMMSMSEEIASFRSVADLVCDMVAAEEGRAVGEKK